MTCRLCIFLENGKVYAYFTTNKLIGLHEFNYGFFHKIELIGNLSREEVKKLHPHATFANFNELGKNRIERKKILELEPWQTGLPPVSGRYYVKNLFESLPVYLHPFPKGSCPGVEEDFITWGFTKNDDPEDLSLDDGPTPATIQWKQA